MSGVGAREDVQQVVTIPRYRTAGFVIYSTVGAAGRAFVTLVRYGQIHSLDVHFGVAGRFLKPIIYSESLHLICVSVQML